MNSLLVIEGDAKDLGDVDLRLQALFRCSALFNFKGAIGCPLYEHVTTVRHDVMVGTQISIVS